MTISPMAVLAGADGPTAIHRWAVLKKNLLLQALGPRHGIPSRDAIRRVLFVIKVEAFQSRFVSWLKVMREVADICAGIGDDEQCHMAIDGKTMKGSHNRPKGLGPMHLVTVWLSDHGLTLAQVVTEERSNEITAIPEVLKLVDLHGEMSEVPEGHRCAASRRPNSAA